MIYLSVSCLVITLAVMQIYVTSDTHAHTHRLLPLVLGLSAVYEFYETFKYITGLKVMFTTMEDLLLLQLLYLLLCYARDFLHLSLPKWLDIPLFFSLIGIDSYIFYYFKEPDKYHFTMLIFVCFYVLLIFIFGTHAYFTYSYSKRDIKVTTALYTALLFPTMASFLHILIITLPDCILLSSVAFSGLIIFYLIMTNQLVEPTAILHEQIFSHSELPLVLFDPDYYFLNANDAARKIFHSELNDEELTKKNSSKQQEIINIIKQIHDETDVTINGNTYRFCLTPIYHKNKIHGYLLSFTDITDQIKETKQMEEKKDYAEHQTLLKSQFLARMSHDLRTPLHAIIGISDILIGKRDQSVKNHKLIKQINTSGKTLLELVNSILDYSKLEAKKLELVNHEYHIDTVFNELAQMCFTTLGNKSIDFLMSVETNFYDALYGDPMRVREIIQNILSNAMKYTEKGSVICRIYCENKNDKAYFECEIKDTGKGMSPEQIEHIFTEYSSYTASTSEESSGLGMVIVRQLVDLMDGDIRIESDGKTGTCVTVSFYQEIEDNSQILRPTVYSDHKNAISLERSAKKLPSAVYPNARVLIADDMDINLQIFTELTRPWKFKVDGVHSGEEAIEAVKKNSYDLIFLDLLMPGKTGLETASEIKKITSTPQVLLSANLITDARDEYSDCGFVDMLEKPIHLTALKRTLEKYLPDSTKVIGSVEDLQNFENMDVKAKARIMDTFVKEMTPLAAQLKEYCEKDFSLFRSKIHGIKGASKQLSRTHLAEQAEIMEMAAKTENYDFIEKHIDNFLDELYANINELTEQRDALPAQEKPAKQAPEVIDIDFVIKQCQKAFDDYDSIEAEKLLGMTENATLGEKEKTLFEHLNTYLDELEYEKGSMEILEYFKSK